MIYFHGGRYVDGGCNDDFAGPDFFMSKNVILVSIPHAHDRKYYLPHFNTTFFFKKVTLNFRLGILGFLSLGTPEISGNMGMKDQVLAMKWVKENIHKFGGDNKKITIFGQSSGNLFNTIVAMYHHSHH